jgi:hypothetical protein
VSSQGRIRQGKKESVDGKVTSRQGHVRHSQGKKDAEAMPRNRQGKKESVRLGV